MIIILKKIFLRVLYASLTSTTIALLILFIGKIFKDKLTPRFHHILWLLVLIRLLMPFAPESNLSIFNLLPGSKDSISLETLIPSTKETEPFTKRQIDMAINTQIELFCGKGSMHIFMKAKSKLRGELS